MQIYGQFISILVLVLGLQSIVQAEETNKTSAATESVNSITTSTNLTPKAAPKWKMATTATYTDLAGTQAAATYSFGDVHVYNQNFVAERTLNPNQKLMVKAQYIHNDYLVNSGVLSYREVSSGLGDTLVNLSSTVAKEGSFMTVVDTGVYLPTGSTNVNHEYVSNVHYKYFLQLGSGTVDPSLSIAEMYNAPAFQTGAKLTAVPRFGHNKNGYRLGDMYRADAWGFLPVGNGFTLEALGYFRKKTAIDGQDSTLSLAATQFYYHDQNDWAIFTGVKYSYNLQPNLSLIAEAAVPATQGMSNFDNVVISTRYFANLTLSGTF